MNSHHFSRTLQPAPIPLNNPWNNVQELTNCNALDKEKLNLYQKTGTLPKYNITSGVSDKKENDVIRIKQRKKPFTYDFDNANKPFRGTIGKQQEFEKIPAKAMHYCGTGKRYFNNPHTNNDIAFDPNYNNTTANFDCDNNGVAYPSIENSSFHQMNNNFLPLELTFSSSAPNQPQPLVSSTFGEFTSPKQWSQYPSILTINGGSVPYEEPVVMFNPFLYSPPIMNVFEPSTIPSTPNPFYDGSNSPGTNNSIHAPIHSMQGLLLSDFQYHYPPQFINGSGVSFPHAIPMAIPITGNMPFYKEDNMEINVWNKASSNLNTVELDEHNNERIFYEREQFCKLRNQIKYYFSVENLCKDMYLRKQMDMNGFIESSIIKGFTRVRQLTIDSEELFDCVVESIEGLEINMQDENTGDYKIRLKDNWEKWVLQK